MGELTKGVFTWFGGPRAISTDSLELISFIRKYPGFNKNGEVVVLAIQPGTNTILSELVLEENVEFDDHNVPGIYEVAKDEYLVGYTYHHTSNSISLCKIQFRSGNLEILTSRLVSLPEPCTYVYIARVSSNQLLIITRSMNFNMTGIFYDIDTYSLSAPFMLFPWQVNSTDKNYSGNDGNRPYLIIRDTPGRYGCVFALTNDHPRAYRNGVFAGRIIGKHIQDLSGHVVHDLYSGENWEPFEVLTKILPKGAKEIPWVHDVREDKQGNVAIACSSRRYSDEEFKNQDKTLDNFKYSLNIVSAQGKLKRHFFPAGNSLYDNERDYVGGIAINPMNIFHVLYSTNSEVSSANKNNVRQLWEVRCDLPKKTFRLISSFNCEVDEIRPIFSECNGLRYHSIYFLKGVYKSYTDSDTFIQKISFNENDNCMDVGSLHYDLPYSLSNFGFLPELERETLTQYLSRCESFFEFGAGGSTLLALSLGVKNVTSVDSDAILIDLLNAKSLELSSAVKTNFIGISIPTSKIGAWGYNVAPKKSRLHHAIRYSNAFDGKRTHDLVLIDGRYRVRCFFQILRKASHPLTILWDDYLDRNEYRRVEEFVSPDSYSGRMAIFHVKNPTSVKLKMQHYLECNEL